MKFLRSFATLSIFPSCFSSAFVVLHSHSTCKKASHLTASYMSTSATESYFSGMNKGGAATETPAAPAEHASTPTGAAQAAHQTTTFSPLTTASLPTETQQQINGAEMEQATMMPSTIGSFEPYGDVNTTALLEKSTFPIKPDDLIVLAKETVFLKGIGLNDNAECLADDFVFRAAFVETPRDEFIRALQSFNLQDSFDIRQHFFGWQVDPLQPNRVWFMGRQEATHVKDFFGAKASGKRLMLPPETLHVDFNKDGQLQEFGFYTVDRAQGNTGGLGGAFGYFYGVGRPLPFPEGKPYKMSWRRRFFTAVGKLMNKFNRFNKVKDTTQEDD